MKAGDFLIVAIGASAGGMEPLMELFSLLPGCKNTAFIVIRHLHPDYKSEFSMLLQKYTQMPVLSIEGEEVVEPGKVYVLPEAKTVTIKNGILKLTDRPESNKINNSINEFFFSLADDMHERAVAVVLSGHMFDGAEGSKYVKEKGGLVIIQDPSTAKVSGMPREAVLIDYPNHVVPVSSMPEIILKAQEKYEVSMDRKMPK